MMKARYFLALATMLAVGLSDGAEAPPSILVVPGEDLAPWAQARTAAGQVLGWRIGFDLADYAPDFMAAVQVTRPLGGFIGGVFVASEAQRTSLSIPRPVGPSLMPGELVAAQSATNIVGYRIDGTGADTATLQKKLQFAKAWKAELVLLKQPPNDGPALAVMAGEVGIKVAICGPAEEVASYIRDLGPLVGACIDTAQDTSAKPAEKAVDLLKERLMVLELRDRSALGQGDVALSAIFNALYVNNLRPLLLVRPSASSPNPVGEIRQSLSYLDEVLRPYIARKVMETSPKTDIRAPDSVSPEMRNLIDTGIAGIPQHAIAKARKPRRLLVLDLNIAYPGHASIPAHNYALTKLAARTRAFQVTFSNDLNNLKYPSIKQFDGIFLNNTVGMLFADSDVQAGLLRYIREGGGLAGIHAASHAEMDWPEFGKLLGARGGTHREPTEKVWLAIDDPHGPLDAAFRGQSIEYQDEFFHFVEAPYDRSRIHLLLSVDVARTDMAQGQVQGPFELGRQDSDYAISWIRNEGKGRIFYTVLGHNPTLFANTLTAQHVLAGIQFVLGDLQADASPNASTVPR